MAELYLVRHGQAAFGADNYDQLSDLGRRQSRALGAWLKARDFAPDRLVTGTLTRQIDTLTEMGFDDGTVERDAGFNEYDFHDLLKVRFGGEIPDPVLQDRKTHFRTLRDTVLEWQSGGLVGASESFATFEERTTAAMQAATRDGAKRVLVVSSGGAIGQISRATIEAPAPTMMELNLQVRNTSVARFVFSKGRIMLQTFNWAPHFDLDPTIESYS
ncbi:MAG: histidine phosphatase family protein [Rhodobacteraceae bacterium]|nr:histidine phosphatase family protein [Paracoccaceae bacterium]